MMNCWVGALQLYLIVIHITAALCLSLSILPTPPPREGSSSSAIHRRRFLASAPAAVLLVGSALPVHASNDRISRSDGYPVQKSESEWRSLLSPMQYYILREGGTERPNSSVLEAEERPGVFSCAGCGTDLFESSQKFHSGTGWPSFAKGLPGVEIEQVGAIQERLLGAELRCRTCGGHLGDVFSDGYLFVGTPAFVTGKRLCIDGAALVFHPDEGELVRGDFSKPKTMPSWLQPPEIKPAF